MVPDLKMIRSHPDKLLSVHIEGVRFKMHRKNELYLADIAALFHDLGKINPNFQAKLDDKDPSGYSQHSYISAYAFLNYFAENKQQVSEKLKIEGYDYTKLKIILALILHHHGNLPNLSSNFTESGINDLTAFLDKNHELLPISDYLLRVLTMYGNPFELSVKPHYFRNKIADLSTDIDYQRWQKDALNYFMDTQYSFACLIEADKRDAGKLDTIFYDEALEKSVMQLETSLNRTFSTHKNDTDLNKLRTEIRLESVNGLNNNLKQGQRVFSLTAPTGAGKTFALLSLANEIQKQKGKLGVIYALPFLSITEQVQSIAENLLDDLLSVTSKSWNDKIDKAQKDYEGKQTKESLKEILKEDFIQQTFDHPFVITTFVQLFETLVSNRNSTLLKLPNFSNRIFLIDEIQALPPRLYIFFACWLEAFCKKYNSYAILSSATMPEFSLPNKKDIKETQNPKLLFKTYQRPNEILDSQKFFKADVFNRYRIDIIDNDNFDIDMLANHVLSQELSCLIILNTIKDTKQLYSKLEDYENVYLLNTHFTPIDRALKIRKVKDHLDRKEKTILISTQLIEAGVDIDFPIVYRDLCPLPSLIQSAGRCNRNKKFEMGQVYFFTLINDKGKISSELIYRDEAKVFLEFTRKYISSGIQEKQLFEVQKQFFQYIAENLTIGQYKEGDFNMIECINNAQFEKLGQFQLINNNIYGKVCQYYIRENDADVEYDKLKALIFQSMDALGYEESKKFKIEVSQHLKKMSGRILNVRVINEESAPGYLNRDKQYMDIRVLADLDEYSFNEGLKTKTYAIL
jgi:CRISPR-associated endonuclease/helicase Cas3